jgi:hypothetical protein
MTLHVTQQEITAARRVYWWCLWMPLLAVPVWIIAAIIAALLNTRNTTVFADTILPTAIPLLLYLPVFFWAFSSRPFLRAHARQGSILLGLRFLSALAFAYGLIFSDTNPSAGLAVLFILLNACLWFFGSLVGLNQAKQGVCWLGNLRAETLREAPHQPYIVNKSRQEMVAHYLAIFQSGTAAERRAAADQLEFWGEVESF